MRPERGRRKNIFCWQRRENTRQGGSEEQPHCFQYALSMKEKTYNRIYKGWHSACDFCLNLQVTGIFFSFPFLLNKKTYQIAQDAFRSFSTVLLGERTGWASNSIRALVEFALTRLENLFGPPQARIKIDSTVSSTVRGHALVRSRCPRNRAFSKACSLKTLPASAPNCKLRVGRKSGAKMRSAPKYRGTACIEDAKGAPAKAINIKTRNTVIYICITIHGIQSVTVRGYKLDVLAGQYWMRNKEEPSECDWGLRQKLPITLYKNAKNFKSWPCEKSGADAAEAKALVEVQTHPRPGSIYRRQRQRQCRGGEKLR